MLELAQKEYLYNQEAARKKKQARLYDYYIGDGDAIESHLETTLLKTYFKEDIEELQLNWINITEKLINQLSVVYREPATRKVMIDGVENEALTEYLESIYPEECNVQDNRALQFGKLFNTSLTHVVFDAVEKRFKFKVRPSHLYTVKKSEESLYKFDAIMYDYEVNTPSGTEIHTVVWTNDKHYKLDQLGNVVKINPSNINPYGIIPFAKLMVKDCNDFWGVGALDIVNVNEQINLLLTVLINDNVILGTQGTILAINLQLSEKSEQQDGSNFRRVRVGRRHPIVSENTRKDGLAEPRLEHVTTDPYITEVMNTVDWYIKMIAMSKGLNPNSFLSDVKATSGYSKIVDSLEQLEIRKDLLPVARQFERERFEIVKKMNNTLLNTTEGKGLKPIPDNAKIITDFAEITVPKTQDEIEKEREFEFKYNLSTPADWILEKNPDLGESAEEQIRKNKLINDSLREKTNQFTNLFNRGQNNVQTNK